MCWHSIYDVEFLHVWLSVIDDSVCKGNVQQLLELFLYFTVGMSFNVAWSRLVYDFCLLC